MLDVRYETFMGRGPKKIEHWEHWSNPDAAAYMTGIDYYKQPRSCMRALKDKYPFCEFHMPLTDDPLTHPDDQKDTGNGRWGEGFLDWQQEHAGSRFKSEEEMLAFSPVDQGDFTGWNVREDGDYSSEDVIYERYRKTFPAEWDNQPVPPKVRMVSFYNTLFMWPMLTFGYENFLKLCLEPEFDRVMDEFAEISRRVFRAFARLPVNLVVCHDDIVLANGPVCSPKWMHKHIFPRYEEYWSLLKASGKEVVFMVDGCMDRFVDDIMACGALGIISEPYTDYKAIARKHENCFIAGEGDTRVLMRNNPAEIRAMVESMTETGRMSAGYMMCIGNHIPYNIPAEAVKLYFDLSAELAFR